MTKSFTATAICIAAIFSTQLAFGESKKDKNIYKFFDVGTNENLVPGTKHETKKGDVIFALPILAKAMVELTDEASYQGIGDGLGIIGPKKTFTLPVGTKLYKVQTELYEHMYCEVGRLAHFDNCLIDSDGDGFFDLGANPIAKESLVPGKIAHQSNLRKNAAYKSIENRNLPMEYVVIYSHGKKRPRLIEAIRNKENENLISVFYEAIKAPKGTDFPQVLTLRGMQIKLTGIEEKTLTSEIVNGIPKNPEITQLF